MAKTVTAVERPDVRATRAVMQRRASSGTPQYATTATKDAATTVNSLRTAPSVALRLVLATQQKPALEPRAPALRTPAHPMETVVVTVFSVPVANVQVAISSAEVSWVVTKELVTTLQLATARRVRSDAPVVGRPHSEITSASKFNRTSWTVHLAVAEASATT